MEKKRLNAADGRVEGEQVGRGRGRGGLAVLGKGLLYQLATTGQALPTPGKKMWPLGIPRPGQSLFWLLGLKKHRHTQRPCPSKAQSVNYKLPHQPATHQQPRLHFRPAPWLRVREEVRRGPCRLSGPGVQPACLRPSL